MHLVRIDITTAPDQTEVQTALELATSVSQPSPPEVLSDQGRALLQALPSETSEGAGLMTLAWDEVSQLRGFGIVDLRTQPATAEFVVDPSIANVEGLTKDLLAATEQGLHLAEYVIWDHGAETPLGKLARAESFVVNRSLIIMGKSLTGNDHEVGALPDGWEIRPFDVSSDVDQWIELNRRAFASLPDQSAWTREDLLARLNEPWFDAPGFLVLTNPQGEIVGTHWTKLTESKGEVYVLAVHPDLEGSGWGSRLTHAGLHHLRGAGASDVNLYVDSANRSAIALYTARGFTEIARDTQYLRVLGHA